MSITKKLRFEIFKRDGFACVYCGKEPPDVTLEVDHIEPKSKGGSDDPENLITACFDCNRGKRDIPLDKIPSKLSESIDVLKEKESQLSEYRKFVASIRRRELRDIKSVEKIFSTAFLGVAFSETFKEVSLKKFLSKLPLHEVEDSMRIASSRISDADQCIKYFCGICWNKIKANEPVHKVIKMWESMSKSYGNGIGYYKKSEAEYIADSVPLETINVYMRETFSERRSSYWRHFVDSIEQGEFLED